MTCTSLNVRGKLGSGPHSLIPETSVLHQREMNNYGLGLFRGDGKGGSKRGAARAASPELVNRKELPGEEEETRVSRDAAGQCGQEPRAAPPPAMEGAGHWGQQ